MTESAAWAGLIGVLVGGLLTLATGWLVVGRQARLRVQEKIVERRIEAYESIAMIAKEMRETIAAPDDERRDLDQRIPRVLESERAFVEWRRDFADRVGTAQYWLETATIREVYLIQDFCLNLQVILAESPPKDWYDIAACARQDFIDLASGLGSLIADWFARKAHKVRYKRPSWHKHPIEETGRRMNATKVMQEYGSRLPSTPRL